MASAAVGLAERYQRGGLTRLMRPLAILVVVLMVPAAIYATVDGRALQAVLYGLMALMCGAHLMFNPATRPENVERSLEASRRVSDSGS